MAPLQPNVVPQMPNQNVLKPPVPHQNFPSGSQIPPQNGFGSGNPGMPNQMNQPPTNFYPGNTQNRPNMPQNNMPLNQIPPHQLPPQKQMPPQNQPQRKF